MMWWRSDQWRDAAGVLDDPSSARLVLTAAVGTAEPVDVDSGVDEVRKAAMSPEVVLAFHRAGDDEAYPEWAASCVASYELTARGLMSSGLPEPVAARRAALAFGVPEVDPEFVTVAADRALSEDDVRAAADASLAKALSPFVREQVAKDDDFVESDHPRNPDGTFRTKNVGVRVVGGRLEAVAEREAMSEAVAEPEQQQALDEGAVAENLAAAARKRRQERKRKKLQRVEQLKSREQQEAQQRRRDQQAAGDAAAQAAAARRTERTEAAARSAAADAGVDQESAAGADASAALKARADRKARLERKALRDNPNDEGGSGDDPEPDPDELTKVWGTVQAKAKQLADRVPSSAQNDAIYYVERMRETSPNGDVSSGSMHSVMIRDGGLDKENVTGTNSLWSTLALQTSEDKGLASLAGNVTTSGQVLLTGDQLLPHQGQVASGFPSAVQWIDNLPLLLQRDVAGVFGNEMLAQSAAFADSVSEVTNPLRVWLLENREAYASKDPFRLDAKDMWEFYSNTMASYASTLDSQLEHIALASEQPGSGPLEALPTSMYVPIAVQLDQSPVIGASTANIQHAVEFAFNRDGHDPVVMGFVRIEDLTGGSSGDGVMAQARHAGTNGEITPGAWAMSRNTSSLQELISKAPTMTIVVPIRNRDNPSDVQYWNIPSMTVTGFTSADQGAVIPRVRFTDPHEVEDFHVGRDDISVAEGVVDSYDKLFPYRRDAEVVGPLQTQMEFKGLQRELKKSFDDFKEHEHPRSTDGRFRSKPKQEREQSAEFGFAGGGDDAELRRQQYRARQRAKKQRYAQYQRSQQQAAVQARQQHDAAGQRRAQQAAQERAYRALALAMTQPQSAERAAEAVADNARKPDVDAGAARKARLDRREALARRKLQEASATPTEVPVIRGFPDTQRWMREAGLVGVPVSSRVTADDVRDTASKVGMVISTGDNDVLTQLADALSMADPDEDGVIGISASKISALGVAELPAWDWRMLTPGGKPTTVARDLVIGHRVFSLSPDLRDTAVAVAQVDGNGDAGVVKWSAKHFKEEGKQEQSYLFTSNTYVTLLEEAAYADGDDELVYKFSGSGTADDPYDYLGAE